MAKTLLRSGNFDDFLALGENGQTIFNAALQIRETLRLRKQQTLADALAIPQPDENREKIDWYAPNGGTVISWAAATLQQREQALRYLETCLSTARKLSKRCQQSDKSSIQLFGILLENVFRFPASQHLYLVDNKPVITFWGFSALNADYQEDPLAPLRATLIPEPEPEPDPIPEPEPVAMNEPTLISFAPKEEVHIDDPQPTIVTLSAVEKPQQPAEAPTAAPRPAPVAAASTWPKVVRRVAMVGIVLIAIPAAWEPLSRYVLPLIAQNSEPAAQPSAAPEPAPVMIPQPAFSSSLPLAQATVVTPPAAEKDKPETTAAAEVPISKDALVLPAASVKAGTTRFLNGNWRATIEFRDAISGKPPVLRYQINNNAGTVRLTLGDNTTCRTEITSGLMQSGNLVIKNNGKARCSDGSRYTVPEVVCTQGLTGAAQCTGRFDSDTVVPVTFRKVSK